jgi:hypothetical protein
MAYSYQTFSSGQVFTSGQAQQIEDNIRDHRHGADGVGVSGAAWEVVSKGAAFSVTSADAGKLFACYGDFQIDFAAAATLGSNFACAIKNIGSGRIVAAAAVGGYIEGNSYFAVTPGEMYVPQSTGSQLHMAAGNVHGPVRLAHVSLEQGSLAQIDITKCYPGDFTMYEMRISNVLVSSTNILLGRISTNSGSSYIATGYATTAGDTTQFRWFGTVVGSQSNRWSRSTFDNPRSYNNGIAVNHYSMQYSAGSVTFADQISFLPSAGTPVSAIRVFVNSYNFINASIELWGYGRPRVVI